MQSLRRHQGTMSRDVTSPFNANICKHRLIFWQTLHRRVIDIARHTLSITAGVYSPGQLELVGSCWMCTFFSFLIRVGRIAVFAGKNVHCVSAFTHTKSDMDTQHDGPWKRWLQL